MHAVCDRNKKGIFMKNLSIKLIILLLSVNNICFSKESSELYWTCRAQCIVVNGYDFIDLGTVVGQSTQLTNNTSDAAFEDLASNCQLLANSDSFMLARSVQVSKQRSRTDYESSDERTRTTTQKVFLRRKTSDTQNSSAYQKYSTQHDSLSYSVDFAKEGLDCSKNRTTPMLPRSFLGSPFKG